VEDLRRQLQAAEDTAREREVAAAAAAERAAAAQSLIDSLRARAVAAEAEAKPLRAQLAELGDTLDVKVCFVATAKPVSVHCCTARGPNHAVGLPHQAAPGVTG